MKVAFCADLHLWNHRRFARPARGAVAPVNSRAADVLRVVGAARRQAEAVGVTDLFVLGDVFDGPAPEPQLIAELQLALTGGPQGVDVHVLVGNHDLVTDQPGDHALGPLDGHRRIRVYDRPQVVYPRTHDGAVWAVPYRPGRADDYLNRVVEEMAPVDPPKGPQVLALHLGLRTEDTEPWLRRAHDTFSADELAQWGRFQLVAAGNWHGRREAAPGVWQVGALVPTGFDNPGWTGYGSLLVYDGHRVYPLELPGPRFVTATGLDGLRARLAELEAWEHAGLYPAHVSARVPAADRATALELLELYGVEHFEVLADREAREAAARAAAQAARVAAPDGVEEAVRAYVERMDLPADVDREGVAADALGYVAGS